MTNSITFSRNQTHFRYNAILAIVELTFSVTVLDVIGSIFLLQGSVDKGIREERLFYFIGDFMKLHK